jgi:hypothetical protein
MNENCRTNRMFVSIEQGCSIYRGERMKAFGLILIGVGLVLVSILEGFGGFDMWGARLLFSWVMRGWG